MRAISVSAAAALQSRVVPMAVLVRMDLSAPLCLTSWHRTLTLDGDAYLPAGVLGTVNASEEGADQSRPLTFSLSGLGSSQVSLVLQEPVQGREVRLYVAIFDPSTHQVLDAALEWQGALDTMQISEDGQTATIAVNAESAGLDLLRASPVRYTDVDQQRLFPGDLGLQYVTDQAEKTIIWPSASFFRQ